MTLWLWGIVFIVLLACVQLMFYVWYMPDPDPRPIAPSPFDRIIAWSLYAVAYGLSLLRLPFAIPPYLAKLIGVFVLRKHYPVTHYALPFEALRIGGDVLNWIVGILLFEQLSQAIPMLMVPLMICATAEGLRLLTEKGQMLFSAGWQALPHRMIARTIEGYWPDQYLDHHSTGILSRYYHYYSLDDERRIQFILRTIRAYSANDLATLAKLDYLCDLKIVPSTQGMRGGLVRDVARGVVFIHRSWTNDPFLLIGQAMRRNAWYFDPRYLPRPFYYRSQSNRMATLFVLTHARYSLPYALYQFGHEIKSARYDGFYRVLRWLNLDIEPLVQADGTFPFDQGITWLKMFFIGIPVVTSHPMLSEDDTRRDFQRRCAHDETLTALEIAEQYTLPLKYVEEVLLDSHST